MWVFLPLAMAFAIIAGIAIYGALSPSKAKPAPAAPGYRGSLVWGDGIFSNRAQLKAWLLLHGASYRVWVKQHPAAVRLVTPRVRHKPLAKPVRHKAPVVVHKPVSAVHKAVAPVHKAVAPVHKAVAPVATATSRSPSNSLVIWLAVIAGLLFGALAAMPNWIIRRARVLNAIGERELRLGALGAGAAVLLGVIVATLAG